MRNRAQAREIVAARRDTAHIPDHRFDDHARDLVFVLAECLLHGFRIIERQRNRELTDFFENAGRTRNSERSNAGPGFHQ